MKKNVWMKGGFAILLVLILTMSAMVTQVFATTVTVLDGQVSISDSANSNTVSGGTVTIKASGSLFGKKTNNIRLPMKVVFRRNYHLIIKLIKRIHSQLQEQLHLPAVYIKYSWLPVTLYLFLL